MMRKNDVTTDLDVGGLIELLDDADEPDRAALLEAQLVHARIDAFDRELEYRGPRLPDLEPTVPDGGLPEIKPDDMDPVVVRRHILGHGCVIVRGLLNETRAAELVAGIDQANAARAAHRDGGEPAESDAWYLPLDRSEMDRGLDVKRNLAEKNGSMLLADSPRMVRRVSEFLTATGLRHVLEVYLGAAQPATSVAKSVLRRVPADSGSSWHQDGAFLGDGIRALNIWTCLSDCGVDAPGLDIVPRRVELLPTGTEGAYFDWSLSEQLIPDAADGVGIHRPELRAGDVVMFDEKLLHRTGVSDTMTKPRYAIETWFFPPSTYPEHHLALTM